MIILRKSIILSLLKLIILSSCYSIDGGYCIDPSEYDKNTAKSYYNSFGTWKSKISKDEAKKLFGCNYRFGDLIYEYSTFFGKKYILVRYGEAITYVDAK